MCEAVSTRSRLDLRGGGVGIATGGRQRLSETVVLQRAPGGAPRPGADETLKRIDLCPGPVLLCQPTKLERTVFEAGQLLNIGKAQWQKTLNRMREIVVIH